MSEHIGVKETKEALIGINELSLCIAERLKDGVGVDDIMAIWEKLGNDPAFKQKLADAIDGYSKIPAEVGDIDVNEGIELAGVQLNYLPKYFETFKK